MDRIKDIELRAQKRCDADPWIEDHLEEALVAHERDALERAAVTAESRTVESDRSAELCRAIAAEIRALKEEA